MTKDDEAKLYKVSLVWEGMIYAENEDDARALFWDDYHCSGGDLYDELIVQEM